MTDLFLKLLNMSMNAGWLVLAVLVLRLILNKAPKFIRPIMWALVGIRLAFPISIESVLSLLPSGEVVPPEIIYQKAPTIHTGVELINSTVNPIISGSLAATPENSINPIQILLFIAANVWVVGIAAMLIYAVTSFIKIKLKVREGILLKDNIYICDSIPTPFILGMILGIILLSLLVNYLFKYYKELLTTELNTLLDFEKSAKCCKHYNEDFQIENLLHKRIEKYRLSLIYITNMIKATQENLQKYLRAKAELYQKLRDNRKKKKGENQ